MANCARPQKSAAKRRPPQHRRFSLAFGNREFKRYGTINVMQRWIIAAAIIVGFAFPAVRTSLAKSAAPPPQETGVNRGVVQLQTGRAAGISVRIAEDLANVIDDGATRRVLPVVGKGALQNISDLNLLHGIDIAILQDDILNYARQQNLFPGLENRLTYIAKLYNEEFHLLARRDIKT